MPAAFVSQNGAEKPAIASGGDGVEEAEITLLHIALWNGDLNQIDEALRGTEGALETRDPRGNRALHLALKFAHRNSKAIVKRLLDAGARVRSRDLAGWKTIHHAIASENEDVLRLLIQREKEQAPGLLEKKLNAVSPRLAVVPDFNCEIHVDVSSWLPGVSRFLPSDTVKIWKRGVDLRFDLTLVGFENGSWQRGNLSFLLLGDEHRFLCLDNDEKTCTNLLSPGAALDDEDLDKMTHFLVTTSIMTTDLDVSALTFKQKRSWLTNAEVRDDVGPWKKCAVHEMTGLVMNVLIRKPQNKTHTIAGNDVQNQSTASSALSMLEQCSAAPGTEIVIEPNAEHVVSIELAACETLEWRAGVQEKDLEFTVGVFPANGEAWEVIIEPSRVSKQHTGSYTATSGPCTVLLKWDNKHSLFRQKRLRFQLSITGADTEESGDWDSHRATERPVKFKEWFGCEIAELPEHLRALHPKQQAMVHVQPPCKKMSKGFPATIYMSDDFPLSMNEFLPVIEVLSKTTSAFENVKEFFTARLEGGFPVQFCFPLVPSVSATFRFNLMELLSPEESCFVVPESYRYYQEDMLSPRTHHEMLQNLTAV